MACLTLQRCYPSPSFLYATINFQPSHPMHLYCSHRGFRLILAGTKSRLLTPGAFNFLSSATIYIYLGLKGNQITAIPSGVFNIFPASKIYFELGNNNISSISPTAFNLSAMTYSYIGLSMNQISVLAPGTFTVSFLDSTNSYYSSLQLSLGSNQLTAIPSSAFNFSSLNSLFLDFSSNKIKSIPFGALNFLLSVFSLYLFLGGNQLTSLPTGLFVFNGLNKTLTAKAQSFPKFDIFKRFSQNIKPNFTPLSILPVQNRDMASSTSCSYVYTQLSNNTFTTILWSAFNFSSPSSSLFLDFSGNQISSISSAGPFNFLSSTPSVGIMLNNNLIKTIPPGVFNFLSNATQQVYLN